MLLERLWLECFVHPQMNMLELYLTLGYWSFPSKFHKPIFYCLCHHIYICNLLNQFFKQIKLISVPSNAHEDLLLGGNVSLFVVTSRAPSNKVHYLGFTRIEFSPFSFIMSSGIIGRLGRLQSSSRRRWDVVAPRVGEQAEVCGINGRGRRVNAELQWLGGKLPVIILMV